MLVRGASLLIAGCPELIGGGLEPDPDGLGVGERYA